MENATLQWHPAFYAGLQIELQEDKDNLIFENEHQLGTKPKEIDALIIKKETDIPVKKNIGRIFRKHNIIEYKSPTDYLSIDDYYKGCAYAYFYKADTGQQNAIPIEELTLTFLSMQYPKKLMKHLEQVHGSRIEERYKGIYYIVNESELLPTQIIVTSEVSEEENLWLRSLTNKLEDKNMVSRLIDEYQKHRRNKLYESVMDIIVKANYQEFEEVRGSMCKALEELMADVIEARVEEKVEERAEKMAKERAEKMAEERAEKIAEKRAEKIAEERAEKIAQERAEKIVEEKVAARMAQMIVNMLENGLPVEQIAQIAKMPVYEIREISAAQN